MSYYNYSCPKCGEIVLCKRMTEPDYTICPYCDSELTRIYRANVNLMFEGSYNNSNHK